MEPDNNGFAVLSKSQRLSFSSNFEYFSEISQMLMITSEFNTKWCRKINLVAMSKSRAYRKLETIYFVLQLKKIRVYYILFTIKLKQFFIHIQLVWL